MNPKPEKGALDPKDTVIRSVRFRKKQHDAIQKAADELGLDFSTYVRFCALEMSGFGGEELARTEDLIEKLKKLADRRAGTAVAAASVVR